MASSLLFLMFQSADTPQVPSALGAGLGIGFMLVSFVIALVIVAGFWKVFAKAGEPGWAAIVPIYNFIVLLKIAGKPAWWVILMFIPLVNLVIAILVGLAVAPRFGKGTGFGLGLGLLGPIFYPILGFGDAQYR